jgi:hypothetical protein
MLNFTTKKDHTHSIASLLLQAYQKALADAFQQDRPCLAFTNPKLCVNEQQRLDEL